MKYLITGGKGVIGTALVNKLRASGNEVWVCDLKHASDAHYYRCDIGNYRQLQDIFKHHKFDCVYHLAAEFGRWNGEQYYDQLWSTNAIGTKNLLKLQEEFGFRMIFASSSEVYGDYDGIMSEQVMEEVEIKQLNDYAMSKWINELQIVNSAAMYGTETVRVRLFNVYGPGEYYSPFRSVIAVFVYRALFDISYNVYLNHQRSSLYIDDCIEVLSRIPERFVPGEVYNIAGTEVHDIITLSDMVLSYLGKGDEQVNYLESEPFTTRRKIADLTKATRDLGFSPKVPLAVGITSTIEWMKAVYEKK